MKEKRERDEALLRIGERKSSTKVEEILSLCERISSPCMHEV